MRIQFLGAAGTVTGSRFLVATNSTRVLIDCGLFQGLKVLRLRNWKPFPVDPASLDAVLLTHAHLDHSGWLPVLVKSGFRGKIFCTRPTIALSEILLSDSGRIQEEDARYANRKGFSKHKPALPLYTEEEAMMVPPLMRPTEYGEPFSVGDFEIEYGVAGHILGAASIMVRTRNLEIEFSGDLGRPHDALIPAPTPARAARYIVMESTYGDREHPENDSLGLLADVTRRTVGRGGVLLIPAFAVGRAQLVLYMLHRLMADGTVPRVPVYLNSPMAQDVTELYLRFAEFHRLSREQCVAAFRAVKLVRTADESKALNRRRGPFIAVAGAGMLTGGRILHHIRAFGDDPRTTILLAGHQAVGTRGAALLRGADRLRIHGRDIPVRAEVARLDGLSAHAGRSELISWLDERSPTRVHLVHGDPEPLDSLRLALQDQLGLDAHVPEHLETVVPE